MVQHLVIELQVKEIAKMTLVPIIYTSLLIFSSLLLFVIVASYISFKLRPKPIAETVIRREFVRPVNINRIAQASAPRVVQSTNNNSRQNYSQQLPNPQIHKERSINQKPLPTRVNKGRETNTKRLEIMNTAEIFNHQNSYSDFNKVTRDSVRVSDSNILNFYSDYNDSKFSSITSY